MELAEHIPTMISAALINLVALISPGPDFILVTRNSLVFDRKTAIWSAIGISVGIIVHVAYILLGLGALIAKTVWLFSIMKFLGCSYLIYIGYKSFKSASKSSLSTTEQNTNSSNFLKPRKAFMMGFLTNATNPKAMLFFLSLFTVIIDIDTPKIVLMICGAEIFLLTLIWFLLVAIFFTSPKVQNVFSKASAWIDRITGSLLIALGAKLALTS